MRHCCVGRLGGPLCDAVERREPRMPLDRSSYHVFGLLWCSRVFCRPVCIQANPLISISDLFIVCCKSDPNFAEKIRHVRDLKTRMAIVWNHCKSKMVCEADEQREEGDLDGDEPKKGHGGCGHLQPQIRKEGLKLFLQYKKPKDEDEVCHERTGLFRVLIRFLGHQKRTPRQTLIHAVGSLYYLDENLRFRLALTWTFR